MEDLWLGALSVAVFPACLIPPLQVCARRTLRPRVSDRATQSLSYVSRVQALRRPLVTALVRVSSVTVSVEFYVAMFCALASFHQTRFLMMLGYVLMLCLFVGNAMKDLVCCPRPAMVTPKEKPVALDSHETEWNREYGLPSTHVANSAGMVLYITQALIRSGLLSSGWAACFVAIGILWVAWIAWGRLYLGMHTPVDLVSGLLLGLGVVGCWLAVEPWIESFLFSGFPALGLVLSLLIYLLAVYPRPERHTPSYETVVTFAGGVIGANCGILHRFPDGPPANAYLFAITRPVRSPTLAQLARVLLTLCIVACARLVTKPVFNRVLEAAFDTIPVEVRQLWQPPADAVHKEKVDEHERTTTDGGSRVDVATTTRFLSYVAVGWSITEGSSAIMASVGL